MRISPLLLISSLILIISGMIGGSGCANVVPPQGGPRDSLPPVLEKAEPGDSSRNFSGNRIHFVFDEFVDAQNAQQELLISPTPRTNPAVDYRLNTVTVKFRDSLESNTTYILNFGNGIKDFNEGNILKGFTYIFSTGPYIDSLELKGKVLLAETGTVDTTLVVMLYKNGSDSAVVKERPRYIARLDGNGNFVFRNLPSGTFYLYALKDESGTFRYMSSKQLFAFAPQPINTSSSHPDLTLHAYAATKEKTATIPTPNFARGREKDDKRLKWQSNISGNLLDLQQDLTLSFDQPLRTIDTAKLQLRTDSTFIPVPNTSYTKDSSNKKLVVHTSWKEGTLYHLILDREFAEDTAGRKLLKTDTLTFKTKTKDDYANLVLHFRNFDPSKNPVLLFMQGSEVKNTYPLTSADLSLTLFAPGEYQLSILNDENHNGKWDPGEFFGKHKQPELVRPLGRSINVKVGAANEFEISL